MRRPSIAPLSVLPLFLDLGGARAVVAGGGAGAAWKAELLAAAGAHVEVHALENSDEMRALLRSAPVAGSVRWHSRAWSAAALDGAVLAVCDASDEREAREFVAAARTAGAMANVIDRPLPGTLAFGSIVNRSPLVVGVSSSGAAPTLAQAARRRIEAVLPACLAGWCSLARRLRAEVRARLGGTARREFWSAFANLAFTRRHDDAAEPHARALLGAETGSRGRVTLVGAGPGGPEHLTLAALRALCAADVVLFDALVSDEVLELARREARRVLVGTPGYTHSCQREDINRLMLKLARKGKHVVRLKSGDPPVFGRAGEEIEVLRAQGIEVSIVPGITAASALAAALGVSLTHHEQPHAGQRNPLGPSTRPHRRRPALVRT